MAQQRRAVGHAVRAGYLYAGAADVARLTEDPALNKAVHALWRGIVELYVTGGVGADADAESHSYAYTLAEDGSTLFVHLYIGGRVQADLREGSMALRVQSELLCRIMQAVCRLSPSPSRLRAMSMRPAAVWSDCECLPGVSRQRGLMPLRSTASGNRFIDCRPQSP